MKSESRAVEAREVPGRFRGEPPVPYWSNGLRRLPSKQTIGVRLPGTAPRAASSMVERQALNLCPVWVQVPGGVLMRE